MLLGSLLKVSENLVKRDKYYLYQYNDNDFRIVFLHNSKDSGYEECTSNKKHSADFEVARTSLSRTKRNIREIALCNNFTHFATLTVNSKFADRFSLQNCQDLLKYKIKEKIRRKNKDFAYIFITEKHKNGAFHFHGLVKNLDFYENKNGYLSNSVFDEIGFNSFSPIVDYTKCCNYITKYITKDCVKNENNQIYISSRGLKKATRIEIKPIDINWGYKNDYCKIRDFSLKECNSNDLLKLMNIENYY